MTPRPLRLVGLDHTFERIAEETDFYGGTTRDDQVEEAANRLYALIGCAMQQIAADITDGIAADPDLTAADVVEALRKRATEISPGSETEYDPMTEWEEGWEDQ